MRCHDVQSVMMRFADQRLAAEQSAKVETHLEVCPRCRSAYEEEIELVAAFHADGLRPAGDLLVAAVMSDIDALAAGRSQARQPRVMIQRGRWVTVVAAAAALGLLWRALQGDRVLWPTGGAGAGEAGELAVMLGSALRWVDALAGVITNGAREAVQLWRAGHGGLSALSTEHFALISSITIAASVACVALIRGFQSKSFQEIRR